MKAAQRALATKQDGRPATIEVGQFHAWILLLSTVRYSLGRMSAAPSNAQELVRRYADILTPEQLAQIGREVQDECTACERRGVRCGMDFDHEGWEKFSAWCVAEGKRRGGV